MKTAYFGEVSGVYWDFMRNHKGLGRGVNPWINPLKPMNPAERVGVIGGSKNLNPDPTRSGPYP